MKIGLIDVDGHHGFPNIPLMKISAWHKAQGDSVEWYDPLTSGHMDKVYMSKVFSFSKDYEMAVDADEVVRGGSGYCIHLEDGREVYDKDRDPPLPYEVEHIYPDYSIYGITDTAYGFLSRGCPRGCSFCHVGAKETRISHKVADLSEFWDGQKNINLCDPNILACQDWKDLLRQLADSKARVEFNQGLDIRLMTEEKAKALKDIKLGRLHFAWDRYEDKDIILPKFELFKNVCGFAPHSAVVYTLTNFDSTIDQDLDRIYQLRKLGYWAYIMRYDKEHIPRGHPLNNIARWVNYRPFFARYETFEDYLKGEGRKDPRLNI